MKPYYILNNESSCTTVHLLTDSFSVKLIDIFAPTNYFLLKVRKVIKELLAYSKSVYFIWIKAHLELIQNENVRKYFFGRPSEIILYVMFLSLLKNSYNLIFPISNLKNICLHEI